MKNSMVWLALGFIAGMYIGYSNERELEDMCRTSKRTKRKMMKNVHKACDNVCDCLNID